MADQTFKDRLPDLRNQYARLKSKAAKGRFIDRIQSTYPFERKFLIKRLTGSRPFKERRGRGKTYNADFERAALILHRASGWMCAPYLKAQMPKLLADFESLNGKFPEGVRRQLLKASEAKLTRLFREHPESHRRIGNRMSGPNRLKKSVLMCPGKRLEDGRPGVCQLDSVAHGGGGLEPHFYSVDLVDAQTQWVEFGFAWCRGSVAVCSAFAKMVSRLPFPLRSLHPDGGGEFINEKMLALVSSTMPNVTVFRSRPGRPNDNCRVEQKNGAILRPYFRNWRLDDQNEQKTLDWIAEKLALYTNLFVPSKRLLKKIELPGKVVRFRRVYDTPKTPLERLREADSNNPALAALDMKYHNINMVSLHRMIVTKIRDVVRRTESRRSGGTGGMPPVPHASRCPRK